MAYTAAQLSALEAALASGNLRVRFQDRDITYRSIDELRQAIQIVQSSLAEQAGTPMVRQIRTYQDGKGL